MLFIRPEKKKNISKNNFKKMQNNKKKAKIKSIYQENPGYNISDLLHFQFWRITTKSMKQDKKEKEKKCC